MRLTTYNKRALFGGIFATIVTGTGAFLLGNLSGYEARDLLASSLPGINTLCNTIALASATILALLLTLLSISSGSKSKLKKAHYKHVLRIARIDTAVFIVALVTFQVLNIPFSEADNVPNNWFVTIYYISLGVSALLSGALISVVLMLYNAVTSIIRVVGLEEDEHPLIYKDDEDEDDEDEDS
ncbi:hypothetical protein [Altibacter lentus]|uniref:hypothetical protein n=1 Tax=Altibacter lentus TaxID=1223410 RepID=UPI000556B909|nr:hypothetical protein [Altibacter lentus]